MYFFLQGKVLLRILFLFTRSFFESGGIEPRHIWFLPFKQLCNRENLDFLELSQDFLDIQEYQDSLEHSLDNQDGQEQKEKKGTREDLDTLEYLERLGHLGHSPDNLVTLEYLENQDGQEKTV